jgi:hypothetical protein
VTPLKLACVSDKEVGDFAAFYQGCCWDRPGSSCFAHMTALHDEDIDTGLS